MIHDIRHPMNGVRERLADPPLTSEQRDYVETIRASGDGLLTIINEILDFSKIDAGKLDLELVPFDLRDCLEDAVDLVAAQAFAKSLNLRSQIDPDVPGVLVSDPTRVRQILVNLLGTRSSSRRRRVAVSVRHPPRRIGGRRPVCGAGSGSIPPIARILFESVSSRRLDDPEVRRDGARARDPQR